MSMKSVWQRAGKAAAARAAVQKTIASAMVNVFKAVKKTPDDLATDLLAKNTTHFHEEEIKRLLAAFKRVTDDRMQASQFDEIIRVELGWSNPVLRKQLFRAFDKDARNELDFTAFVEGYSHMLRGTVPELLDFSWRLYRVSSPANQLTLSDLYMVLRLGLAGLEELRAKQGDAAGGTGEITFSPERTARQMIENMVGTSQAPLNRREFGNLVLRNRRMVDCMVPGFVTIPVDPLHRAAELGDAAECTRLIKVDQFDVDGRDGKAWPTTPLHLACQFGHVEVAGALLDAEASARGLNGAGELPLDVAIRYGRIEMVDYLMSRQVEPLAVNGVGQTAIHTAALYGSYQAINLLAPHMQAKMVVDLQDKQGRSPLHLCAATDQWNVLNIFLQLNKLPLAALDTPDYAGVTALHVAAGARSARVASKLLELGADPEAEDADGRHALHHAVRTKDNDTIISMLLNERRVDVEAEDNDGLTALHMCIATADVGTLRALIDKGADPNAAERGTGLTPLHKAVLAMWLEAVDALLKPGLDTRILKDFSGRTALDYARSHEVFELLRDYLLRTHPVATVDYPVDFVFGLVFDDGSWRMISEGASHGLRALVPPAVPQAVAELRLEANMVDKSGVKRALHKAGLIVLEEKAFVGEKAFGFDADVRQCAFLRVGAPLYRLQQEAMKMRLQCKRVDFDRTEDFFVDQANYPMTGFADFTLAEVQKLLLNIIQAEPDAKTVAPHGGADAAAVAANPVDGSSAAAKLASGGLEPPTAGINISQYIALQVMRDFVVLHDPMQRADVERYWRTHGLHTAAYWRDLLLDMVSPDARRAAFALLEVALKYFGHKLAFYTGFLSFLANWLFAPAIGGLVVFGLEWIDRHVYLTVKPTTAMYTRFYDQPLMFIYGFFICVWSATIVQGWHAKQHEIASRWQVEDFHLKDSTVNPRCSAAVKMTFAKATWTYAATLSTQQRAARGRFLWRVTVPVTLLLVLGIVGRMAVLVYLDYGIIYSPMFWDNYQKPLMDYNWTGKAAVYGHAGLQAIACWMLNAIFKAASQWLVARENWESMEVVDAQLAWRLMAYMFFNNFACLFYYAFWDRDVDKVAFQLAALMITERAIQYFLAFGIPFITRRRSFVSVGGRVSANARGNGSKSLGGPAANRSSMIMSFGSSGFGASKSAAANGGMDSMGRGLSMGVSSMGAAMDLSADPGVLGIESHAGEIVDVPGFANDEIRMSATSSAVKFSELIILFAYVALFSAAFPLAPVAAYVGTFAEVRLDMWKACNLVRRPLAQRTRSLGDFWLYCFELVAVLGVMTHCFMLGMSTSTFSDYFFNSISDSERLIASFSASYFFVAIYFAVRLFVVARQPRWLVVLKQEQLRTIRDAHRVGWMLREHRYEMLIADPTVTMADVCFAEDLDEMAASRYLRICRFLSDLPEAERRGLLLDNVTTIQGLLQTIVIRMRAGLWADGGEKPTAAGLARQLVPDVRLRHAFTLGKRVREAIASAWQQWRSDTAEDASDPDAGSTVAAPQVAMQLRQLGCVACDVTMSQADRCLRFVRYVDSLGNNPWLQLKMLEDRYPGGLLEALRGAEDEGFVDIGEPLPESLGPLVEPVRAAALALEKGDVVRRAMYEHWLMDPRLNTAEMMQAVAEDVGALPASLERYLLIKRYTDDLDARKKEELLHLSKTPTLLLVTQVREAMRDGTWKDPGEPDFRRFVPPIVMTSTGDEGDDEGGFMLVPVKPPPAPPVVK